MPEVLRADLGRQSFSLMTKHRILDFLFKVVNGEPSYPDKNKKKRKSNPDQDTFNLGFPSKRQKENGSSSLLPSFDVSSVRNNAHVCQNLACRATMNPGDESCKNVIHAVIVSSMLTIMILWLFCNSDQPSQDSGRLMWFFLSP